MDTSDYEKKLKDKLSEDNYKPIHTDSEFEKNIKNKTIRHTTTRNHYDVLNYMVYQKFIN